MNTVTTLSRESLVAAKSFVEVQSRPVEAATMRHKFDGAPMEDVLRTLSEFQNGDGGFGNALEPDVRTRHSSVLCTAVAFQTFRAVGASSDLDAVRRALAYLMSAYDPDAVHWRIISHKAQDAPHAPWWDQTGREESFDSFSLNPTAEILGYLHDHRALVPPDVIEAVTDRVVAAVDTAESFEMHDLQCLLRLLATPDLPNDVDTPIRNKVSSVVGATVAREPEDWSGYSLRPLQVVDGPDSPFMTGLEEAVEANLSFEILSQDPNGSWRPTWSWADTDSAAWALAENEWAGVITLKTLSQLHRFGRIEGLS